MANKGSLEIDTSQRYRLGVFKGSLDVKYSKPNMIVDSDDLNTLVDKAREFITQGYYLALIYDSGNLIIRINSNFEEYQYLPEDACQRLSGLMYQLCDKLGIRKNFWYRLSAYSEYDSEIVLECKEPTRTTSFRIHDLYAKSLIETFIVNMREASGGYGVKCIIFNALEVKNSVNMYICYRMDSDDLIRVELRKRY